MNKKNGSDTIQQMMIELIRYLNVKSHDGVPIHALITALCNVFVCMCLERNLSREMIQCGLDESIEKMTKMMADEDDETTTSNDNSTEDGQ